MSLKYLNIQKTIFIFLLIFFTIGYSKVYSAPTDCLQLAADGTINCTKAKSQFFIGVSGSKIFDTFDALVEYEGTRICNAHYKAPAYECYVQFQNSPTYPPSGREICSSTCNKFTHINYNTSIPDSGRLILTILRNDYPYYQVRHGQNSTLVYHARKCPQYTTAISAGEDTYIFYCKPYEVYYNPAPCDTGQCNKQTGSSTLREGN